MRLENKVAIVTGASSGLGLAIATKYVAEGASVVLSDVNEEVGQAAASKLGDRAIFVKCDVSKSEEVNALVASAVEKYGKLDIMVNNAGIGSLGGALECSDEVWAKTIGINFSGVFYGVRAAGNEMKKAGTKGAIINMSSILGLVGMPGAIAYCAAKGGVSNITRAASLDLAAVGIRVNAISPAFIETNMTRDILQDEQFSAFVKAGTPLGYVGQPEDVAGAAVYLASDEAKYVTGIVLPVDGGWTAR